VIQVKLCQVVFGLRVQVAFLQPNQRIKQIKITENGREELPVIIAIRSINYFAIEPYLAGFRRI